MTQRLPNLGESPYKDILDGFLLVSHNPDGTLRAGATGQGITKDLVRDFGASPLTGSDEAAFFAFRAFARAQTVPVVLTMPPGYYSLEPFSLMAGNGTDAMTAGIKDLTIEATGAVLDYIWLGSAGQLFNGTNSSARLATVTVGATTVTLLTLSDVSKFSVGQPVLLTALDLQGFGGPSNPYYFEWNRIADINAATGVITLATPAVNTYKSTYPLYNPGNPAGQPDCGGPATLFSIPTSWDAVLAVNGLTIFGNIGEQVNSALRDITVTDCSFTGDFGVAPSMSQRFRAERCKSTSDAANWEIDKLITTLEFVDCQFTDFLNFQSSNNDVSIIGGTYGSITGTPKRLTLSGATVRRVIVGPFLGMTEHLSILGCTVTGSGGVAGLAPEFGRREPLSDFTYSNGVLSASKAVLGAVPWAVPGQVMFYTGAGGGRNFTTAFTVTDVTEDSGFTRIHTNGPASIPSTAGGDNTHICPYPCLDVTVSNSTGTEEIVDHSTYPLKHRPMLEHLLRTKTSLEIFQNQNTWAWAIWGTLVQLRINVTTPYTGALGTLTMNPGGNQVRGILPGDLNTIVNWVQTVNLKIAGERIITPTTVTGAQSGDSLSAPGLLWLIEWISPGVSADPSGDTAGQQAVVTIELTTDQGLV